MNKSRVDWIDISKFIAISSVVWGHVGLPKTFDIYIHAWHMPIFFFLSGYVFNHNKYVNFSDLFKKRIKTLLIPYFVYGMSLYLIWNVFYLITGGFNEIIPFKKFLGSILWDNASFSPFGTVNWFLTSLFLAEIFFYLILKIVKKKNYLLGLTIFGFSLLGYFYPMITDFRLPWGMASAFTGVVFYGIGYLFRNFKHIEVSNYLYNPKLLYVIMFFIISWNLIFANGYVNMRKIQYNNYFLFYLAAISTIITIIMFSSHVSKKEFFKKRKIYKIALYIGQNTIVALFFNNVYIRISELLLNFLLVNLTRYQIYIIQVIETVIIVLLMVPTAKFINKYLPITLGRRQVNNKYISTKV